MSGYPISQNNGEGKRAFITGVGGQDGLYLAEYLLGMGYQVLGLVSQSDNTDNSSPDLKKLQTNPGFSLCIGDICECTTYSDALCAFAPHEIYNLAAISDLKTAAAQPERAHAVNYRAFETLVECATTQNPAVRIFQALTSRILVPGKGGVIDEMSTLVEPRNAYEKSKRESFERVVLPYRQKGFFIASGFLCNHESPRRDSRFVTGKIVDFVARVARGTDAVLMLGNVEARRDWSFAGDIVRAMHAVLQVSKPDDYVMGSETLHSVREFIDVAFSCVDIQITWTGSGIDMRGVGEDGRVYVQVAPEYYQPDDNPVVSCTLKLKERTSWRPEVSFEQLVQMMVKEALNK